MGCGAGGTVACGFGVGDRGIAVGGRRVAVRVGGGSGVLVGGMDVAVAEGTAVKVGRGVRVRVGVAVFAWATLSTLSVVSQASPPINKRRASESHAAHRFKCIR